MNLWYEWRDAPPADYAVLGDPVSHSRSPAMHGAAYRRLSLDLRYIAIRVPEDEFCLALDRLATLGYRGVNCTVPLKGAAFAWSGSDRPDRSINTLRLDSSEGTNTDAPGFLDTLADRAVPVGRALVLGAGGTARTLLHALHQAGWDLATWNRTPSRLRDALNGLALRADILEEPDPEGCSLILNCTSAGLHGEAPPVQWRRAHPDALAYDTLYGETPFVEDAKRHGLDAIDGKAMLVAQGARSFEWWLGVPAPREVMWQAIQ